MLLLVRDERTFCYGRYTSILRGGKIITKDTIQEEYRRAWEHWFSMIPQSIVAAHRERPTSLRGDRAGLDKSAMLRRSMTILSAYGHGAHAEKSPRDCGMREKKRSITPMERTSSGVWED
jgi:hypothetical protein